MPTTWNAIFLGTPQAATGGTLFIDPTERNTTAENANQLVGRTFGSAGSPLHREIYSVTAVSRGGNSLGLDQNNNVANDVFRVDLNKDGIAEELTFDASTRYNTTVTFHDGTVRNVELRLFQATNGQLFLAAPSNDLPTLHETMRSDAVVSFRINSIFSAGPGTNVGGLPSGATADGLAIDRSANAFVDGIVEGTAGADSIGAAYTGDPEFDRIDNNDATAGYGRNNTNDDLVQGFAGNDTIQSGEGNDTVFAGTGNDIVNGGNGDDLIYGYGNDSLTANASEAGADNLDGGAGNDSLYGGAGTDTLTGGAGRDLLDGGADNDSLYGDDSLGTGPGDIDIIFGGGGADLIVGGAAGDSLNGGTGNDIIYGDDTLGTSSLGGADSIDAGAGDDSVVAGIGDDTVIGGLGADTIYGNAGNDTIYGDDSLGADSLGGADRLFGGEGNDSILGGFGDDSLDGGIGNDSLQGGAGADTLLGGEGDDLLEGGDGNDTLEGGAGSDTLVGGGGQDTFIARDGDTILDFYTGDAAGERDSIDLSAFYNEDTLARWNAANPNQTFKRAAQWMRADQADDGRLNMLDGQNGLPTLNMSLQYNGAAVTANTLIDGNTSVLCFSADALIETPEGAVPAGDLQVGMLVTTRDAGPQPIRWIGRRSLTAAELEAAPNLRPIRIRAGALGRGTPRADLVVSPQHRVLVRSKLAQRLFGAPEVLVAAKQLLLVEGIDVAENLAGVDYVHFLFDDHQVVWSNGAETESLHPGRNALNMAGEAGREEIFAIFPELRDESVSYPAARMMASGRMGRKLAMRHVQNNKPLVS